MPDLKLIVRCCAAMGLVSGGLYFLEGNSDTVYLDGGHYATVCRGVLTDLPVGAKVTDAACKKLNAEKEQEFLEVVHKYVHVHLTPEREAALVWFAYNVGEAGFKRSSAVRLINAGKTTEGCEALMKWNTVKGVPNRGLTNRRAYEISYCLMHTDNVKDYIWDLLE